MSDMYQSNAQEAAQSNSRTAPDDYIGAVCDLLHLCQEGKGDNQPADYVVQVQKVKGHIHRILVSNGVETS